MYSAFQVANYFAGKVDEDAGDLISNLKMQKLLYYAQGFSLAYTNEPLFPEKIFAWTHGPVVAEVYYEFKKFGNGGIPCQDDPWLDEATKGLLDEVYEVFGQFSAWKLRNMTHQEKPWTTTKNGAEIEHALLADYFKTQLT